MQKDLFRAKQWHININPQPKLETLHRAAALNGSRLYAFFAFCDLPSAQATLETYESPLMKLKSGGKILKISSMSIVNTGFAIVKDEAVRHCEAIAAWVKQPSSGKFSSIGIPFDRFEILEDGKFIPLTESLGPRSAK